MRNMSEAETKVRIAKRVAEMLPDGGFVNLGVGIPTMAVDIYQQINIFTFRRKMECWVLGLNNLAGRQ